MKKLKEKMNSIQNRAADNIRVLIAAMVERANSGHPGGAMGGADFLNILFSEFLIYDPANPEWICRDRFYLDPGHMSPLIYSVLALAGKFTMEELKQFRQWGSVTPGHPERDLKRGIENTSGPLGQGHAFAVGSAIAAKFLEARLGREKGYKIMNHKIYAYISDGAIQEEISQGAGRIAGTLGLNNLIMFYDSNNIQLSTRVDEVSCEDVAAKYRAWNWNVINIDGNDAGQIRSALAMANAEEDRPTIIIGKTIMGKGAVKEGGERLENSVHLHGTPLSAAGASFSETVKNLGGDPENPFVIFPEVEELYLKRGEELTIKINERNQDLERLRIENPVLHGKMNAWFSGNLPEIEWTAIQHKPGQATRNASGVVLGYLSGKLENMICASADLSASDKTDGFLKNTTAFAKHNFAGSFLQAGVSELSMAAIAVGMALHGGVIPVCATFFCFSDYMKPVLRVASLMETPVIFVWSHDSFRVGEDGPTHQPVEHEAQIRLLEKLRNHSGNCSFIALRPADSAETTCAWKFAVENKKSPTGIILSRQPVKDLPTSGNRSEDALRLQEGAYIVTDYYDSSITLIASGADVATLVEVSVILRERGFRSRVVSMPSEGLFESRPESYRNSVISPVSLKFGLTSGIPSTLAEIVGDRKRVFGLESFGYSAPQEVLEQKLGFTPGAIAEFIIRQIYEP